MKIGLDIHGVIDSDPAFFSDFTKSMHSIGNEVHIITGEADTPALRKRLVKWKIKYDELFSITTTLLKLDYKVWYDRKGDPWFDNEIWNSAKGNYCSIKEIDLHFDDSPEYFEHFETPFVFFTKKKYPKAVKSKRSFFGAWFR